MDWKPMSEWKPKKGKSFVFYYPAEPSRPYRDIGYPERYTADTAPSSGRQPTHFAAITAPNT